MNMEFYRPESIVSFIILGFLIFFIFRTHLLRKKYSELLHTSKTLEISETLKLPKNRLFKEILFVLVFNMMESKKISGARKKKLFLLLSNHLLE